MSTTLDCIQWMVNQEGQTPCMTAQEVGQLCNNEYTVSLMNFEENNYVPSATTANGCTCSWSIYNLLSACSYCVGQHQYPSWSTWITDCGNYTSNTSYLPSGLSLSEGIPFWAVTNPATWANETFNITQAADKAAQDQPDVTGGAIPTSTMTTSSSSSVPVGSIVGLVIGACAIIIIGGLFILWALCCRRRQRTRMAPVALPSFNPSQSVVVPPVRDQPPVLPISSSYPRTSFSLYHTPPNHSTTSLAPTSLVARVSSGFSSTTPSISLVTDAADMISPFLATTSSRQTDRAPQTGKANEALSERVMAPPGGQRTRLNPPPYTESAEPGSSGPVLDRAAPRMPTKKRTQRKRSASAAANSRDSRPSTRESVATILTGARTEQSQPLHVALTGSMGTAQGTENVASTGGVDGDDGNVEMTHGDGGGGDSDQHPEV